MSKEIYLEDVLGTFDELLEHAESASYLIIDKQIQIEQRDILVKYLLDIKKYKKQAVEQQEEGIANLLLYYQCAFNSKISHLEMCLSVKDEKAHEAWCHLIDMQEYFEYAMRAFRESILSTEKIIIDKLLEYKKRIQSVEDVIFHKMPLYQSCGFRLIGGICSICRKPVDICTHIESMIYMGSVCKRILTKNDCIEIDHGALVENPKDRRCIITKLFDSDGNGIDYITKKKLSKKNGTSENCTFEGILISSKQLDIF